MSEFTEAERTALADLEKSLSRNHTRMDCNTFDCMYESDHPAIKALRHIVGVASDIDVLAMGIAHDLLKGGGVYPLERIERLSNRLDEVNRALGKEYEFILGPAVRKCFDA